MNLIIISLGEENYMLLSGGGNVLTKLVIYDLSYQKCHTVMKKKDKTKLVFFTSDQSFLGKISCLGYKKEVAMCKQRNSSLPV